VTPSSEASLRIAVVGPTHPAKGGVASHTTMLAHELVEAGHDVVLVSWARMFPKVLYPGEQHVPEGAPDVAPFERTVPVLHWNRPETWVRTGRRLRDVDLVVLVHVIPQVVPAHLAIVRAARGRSGGGPRVVGLVHNVLPHESRPGDGPLMRLFLSAVDAVLVHSQGQAAAAAELGAHRVAVAGLPPHLPGGEPLPRHSRRPGPTRLLALGIVRDYKGLDLVLDALAEVPDVDLTIAGEMWGDAGERVRRRATSPDLADRVTLREGYVPATELAGLLADHDVLVLAYRHATGSQNVLLAHHHGLAVLATDVGTFGGQVRDDVDGLVVPPADHEALVAALRRLADADTTARLVAGVRPPDLHGPWATYVGTLEALAAAPPAEDVEGSEDAEDEEANAHSRGARALGAVRAVASRAAAGRLHREPGTVHLVRGDFPAWVRPSDLLSTETEADEAHQLARALGLGRTRDPLASWAALGALAAIVRVQERPGHDVEVVDCSGADSPIAHWLRQTGHTPTEWTVPDGQTPLDALEIDSGSCDVLTLLHPSDCEAEDVDALLTLAGWVLRRGGLLSFTVATGAATVPGAVGAADVRGIIARADDRGLQLVGDVDGDVTDRLRDARLRETDPDAAFGIVRLTFRRR
jgi:glycosyltransferase involved in cell wall biosynthesis